MMKPNKMILHTGRMMGLSLMAIAFATNAHAGVISTFAGNDNGALLQPFGVKVSAQGDVYVADTSHDVIRKITQAGVSTIVAGTGSKGYSGDGGLATTATLNAPAGLFLDAGGNLYFTDSGNNVIRKIDTTGNISTVAGTGIAGHSGDGGSALAATLNGPLGLTQDGAGNLYVAEGTGNVIRKISVQGIVSTYAGTGTPGYFGDGGAATAAMIHTPFDVAIDALGNLYVADFSNFVVRKVSAGGIISTYAGNQTHDCEGDGGPASAASLNEPSGLALDGTGDLLVSEFQDGLVRRIDAAGIITTIAGHCNPDPGSLANFPYAGGGDGGPATSARLLWPEGLAADGNGNVYVADSGYGRIREVVAGTAGFFASTSGSLTAQTITATIAPTQAAIKQSGATFVAALLPSNQIFLLGPNGWTLYNANAPIAYGSGQLGTTSVQVVNGLNLSGLVGTKVIVGYGRGTSASQSFADLLSIGTYQYVYQVH